MPKTAIQIVPVSTLIAQLNELIRLQTLKVDESDEETIRGVECSYVIDIENTLREATPNPEESQRLRFLLLRLVDLTQDDRVRARAEALLEKGW